MYTSSTCIALRTPKIGVVCLIIPASLDNSYENNNIAACFYWELHTHCERASLGEDKPNEHHRVKLLDSASIHIHTKVAFG